jgi:hypothetical protein
MASEGYPDKPRGGQHITGLTEAAADKNVKIFHAGTKIDQEGKLVTHGGRVLSVTALGATVADARATAYNACSKIKFAGAQYRTDIGTRGSRRPLCYETGAPLPVLLPPLIAYATLSSLLERCSCARVPESSSS